jgi:hypothetical protein
MERDKSEKKKLQNENKLRNDKNNITISVNIGNADNKNLDESISIQEPIPKKEQKKAEKKEQKKIDDTDILIQQLKDLIKELNAKKQSLIDNKIDIPNDLFDLPDIELNSRREIVMLIDVIKEKIRTIDTIIMNRMPSKTTTPPVPPQAQTLQTSMRTQLPFGMTPGMFGSNVRTNFGQPITTTDTRTPPKGQQPPKDEPPKEEPPKEQPPKEETPKEEPPKEETPKEEPPKKEPREPNPDETQPPPKDESEQPPTFDQSQIDEQKRKVNARKATLLTYMENLQKQKTDRGKRGNLILERNLNELIDRTNLALDKLNKGEILTPEELGFAIFRTSAVDNAQGLIPPAKAYFQVRSERLGSSDVINFVEDKTKNIIEGGRTAFTLFFNGREIIDNINNVPIFFNSDGNIYNDSIDNVNQTPPAQPPTGDRPEDDRNPPVTPVEDEPPQEEPPQEEPPQEEPEQNEREKELLEYRRNLYNTGRRGQSAIVDFLNEEISQALVEDKLITLDVLDIPSAIAYRRSTMRDSINIIDKNTSGLRASPLDRPADPALMPFLLYINNTLQLDNFEQQLLYNEFGDIYSVQDFSGEQSNITFPYRPTSRTDLSAPQQTESTPDPDRRFEGDDFDEEEADLDQIPTEGFRPPSSNLTQQVTPTPKTKRKPIINPISTIVGSTRTTTGVTQEVTRKSEEGFFGQLFDYIEALFEDGPVKDELKQSQLARTPLEP